MLYNEEVLLDFKNKIRLDISNSIRFASAFYTKQEIEDIVYSSIKSLKYGE